MTWELLCSASYRSHILPSLQSCLYFCRLNSPNVSELSSWDPATPASNIYYCTWWGNFHQTIALHIMIWSWHITPLPRSTPITSSSSFGHLCTIKLAPFNLLLPSQIIQGWMTLVILITKLWLRRFIVRWWIVYLVDRFGLLASS